MKTDPQERADPSASGKNTVSYPEFLARLAEYKRAVYETLYHPANRTEIEHLLTNKPNH